MIELPLGIVAWVACILLQAIVHYKVMPRRRRKFEVDPSTLSTKECDHRLDPILEEDDELDRDSAERTHGTDEEHEEDRHGELTPQALSPPLPASDDSGRPMKDEPRQIQQLLNQTGSELLNASWSPEDSKSMSFFELLAREQLESHDRVGGKDETEALNAHDCHSLYDHTIDVY